MPTNRSPTLTPSWSAKIVVLGLIAVAGIGAALLYHLVEEPARRWMRRMVDTKAPQQKPAVDLPQNRLQSVGARAG